MIALTLDQPTGEVRAALAELVCVARPGELVISDAPFSPFSGGRDRFMELREFQRLQLRGRGLTHGTLWDDDHLLGDPGEARKVLQEGADLVYARKLFLWDRTDQVNTKIPEHNSVLFFKWREDDRGYPTDTRRVINAPETVHDDPGATKVQLDTPLLDNGYLKKEERAEVWRDYCRIGKIDAITHALVQPPTLQKIEASRETLKALER